MNDFMKIFLFLRSLFTYIIVGIVLLFLVPVPLFIALFGGINRYKSKTYFWFLDKIYGFLLILSFLPKDIDALDLDQPSIIVANHQSSIDILLLGHMMKSRPHVWLAMEYYAKFPILGTFLSRMNIPVNNSDKVSASRSLVRLINFLKQYDSHLIIFPEGGRYVVCMSDFFEGFAVVARRTGRPVVPVYMPNNGKIYPPLNFLINWCTLKAVVGPKFEYQEGETDTEFKDRIFKWFLEQCRY